MFSVGSILLYASIIANSKHFRYFFAMTVNYGDKKLTFLGFVHGRLIASILNRTIRRFRFRNIALVSLAIEFHFIWCKLVSTLSKETDLGMS